MWTGGVYRRTGPQMWMDLPTLTRRHVLLLLQCAMSWTAKCGSTTPVTPYGIRSSWMDTVPSALRPSQSRAWMVSRRLDSRWCWGVQGRRRSVRSSTDGAWWTTLCWRVCRAVTTSWDCQRWWLPLPQQQARRVHLCHCRRCHCRRHRHRYHLHLCRRPQRQRHLLTHT